MSLIITDGRAKLIALYDGATLISSSELSLGDYLATSLTVIEAEDESEYVGTLDPTTLPPLPPTGTWMEIHEIYAHGEIAVMVRQSHYRTEHEPADVPALFVVYREDSPGLPWIVGEPVDIGTVRVYDDVAYTCIQPHVTQSDWTPPLTPTLWEEVETGTGEPEPWVQPTGGHDAYNLGDQVTYGGQTWESTINANVWAPGVYGWVVVP